MSSQSRFPSEATTNIFHEQTASSILLIWDKPDDEDTFEGFVVKYKEHGSKQNFKIKNIQQINKNKITLDNLKCETEYIIKGSISRNNGTVDQLFETVCKTKPSPLSNLFGKSTLLDENPPIYKLPCTIYEKEKEVLRECHIGRQHISLTCRYNYNFTQQSYVKLGLKTSNLLKSHRFLLTVF